MGWELFPHSQVMEQWDWRCAKFIPLSLTCSSNHTAAPCYTLHLRSCGSPASCAAGLLNPPCRSSHEESCRQRPRSHSLALQHPALCLALHPAPPQPWSSLDELPQGDLCLLALSWLRNTRAAVGSLPPTHPNSLRVHQLSHMPCGIVQRPYMEGPACGAQQQAVKHPGAGAPQQPALARPRGHAGRLAVKGESMNVIGPQTLSTSLG